jgi:hypothetical protein
MCISCAKDSDVNDFDVHGHVEDLVAFFATIGLSECQMFEVIEEMILDALGANQVRH